MRSTALVLAACVALGSACGVHTRPFRTGDGAIVAGSVATMESAVIGGVKQHLWFRGHDRNAPALLFLHAGPGVSEAAMFRTFHGGLERHFLVVYWEQRGAGRSYDPDAPPESMTIARFLADLDEVVELIRHRFGKPSVVLVGHSWGTVLGTIYAHEHPEKVAAYVGVGQFVDVRESERLWYEYVLGEAERAGDRATAREIRAGGAEPRSVESMLALRDAVERYGGAFHADLSMGDLVRAMLMSDEANLADLWYLRQGSIFSLQRMWNEIAAIDLRPYRSFAVPTLFAQGRHDRLMPASLAAAYFETIEAPCKRLVWFEQSAHYPLFEEPEKFEQLLVETILPLARSNERAC